MRDWSSGSTPGPRATRRTVAAAVVVGLAGCAGGGSNGTDGGDGSTDGTTTGEATDDDPTATPADTGTGASPATTTRTGTPTGEDATTTAGTATDGGLDLREANVTAVEVSERGGGYRFDVTLYHDDDGEDGYANWWDVETRDGERLGRRELLHAHGTREFTRSETVPVPDDVDCVVVRGHDQTHGFGGRAMLVDPRTGATRAVDQGADPVSMADEDCP